MTLAVNQFDKQLTLRIRQLLHPGLIFLHDALLHTFHVLLARLLVGQRLQVGRRLHHNHACLLGNGQHRLYVLHQSHVGTLLFLTAECHGWKDIDIVHLHVLNAVAVLQHLTYPHSGYEGGTVHVHLLPFLVLRLTTQCQEPRANN